MYENIYDYSETINGEDVYILFKPNFREAVSSLTSLGGKPISFYSDKEIKWEEELAYVPEDAQYFLEVCEGQPVCIFVTERTEEINTSLGEEWNKELNRLLKKAKYEYFRRKKEEVRLYFYNASKDKLYLCGCEADRVFKRHLATYCAIDKRYNKPEKDCFILGRIRKTIGLTNSKLLDFIEPVHNIDLDFQKERWDYRNYEYMDNLDALESILLDLLRFCLLKRNSFVELMRIRTAYGYDSFEEISKFKNEIWAAFKDSETTKLRKLYRILVTEQDCTNVKFQLRLESAIECFPNKKLDVYFENGEKGFLPVEWIYSNISNCEDASGSYLGVLRDRYSFY